MLAQDLNKTFSISNFPLRVLTHLGHLDSVTGQKLALQTSLQGVSLVPLDGATFIGASLDC